MLIFVTQSSLLTSLMLMPNLSLVTAGRVRFVTTDGVGLGLVVLVHLATLGTSVLAEGVINGPLLLSF